MGGRGGGWRSQGIGASREPSSRAWVRVRVRVLASVNAMGRGVVHICMFVFPSLNHSPDYLILTLILILALTLILTLALPVTLPLPLPLP